MLSPVLGLLRGFQIPKNTLKGLLREFSRLFASDVEMFKPGGLLKASVTCSWYRKKQPARAGLPHRTLSKRPAPSPAHAARLSVRMLCES